MRRNVTEKNVRDRALKDCKKAGVGPLAAMYVRSGYFIQRASCKPSREPMCLEAMPGGVCCARWTQIDAIARAEVPCSPLEWRLPCQMIFFAGKGNAWPVQPCMPSWGSSCKSPRELMCPGAMPGGVCCARWTQIGATARSDVPWRPLERRLPCQMICRKAPTLGPWWPSPNNRSPHQRTARVREFAGRGYCYLAEGCSNGH